MKTALVTSIGVMHIKVIIAHLRGLGFVSYSSTGHTQYVGHWIHRKEKNEHIKEFGMHLLICACMNLALVSINILY